MVIQAVCRTEEASWCNIFVTLSDSNLGIVLITKKRIFRVNILRQLLRSNLIFFFIWPVRSLTFLLPLFSTQPFTMSRPRVDSEDSQTPDDEVMPYSDDETDEEVEPEDVEVQPSVPAPEPGQCLFLPRTNLISNLSDCCYSSSSVIYELVTRECSETEMRFLVKC